MRQPFPDLRPIAPEATRGLRHEVLRPHQEPSTIVYDHEGHPNTLHLGAFDGEELIGTGTILPDGDGIFRIRGMAVREGRRGGGIGAAILDGLVAHARSREATRIWCNARTPARAFYARAGFVEVGDVFDEPHIGPHVRMELRLG